MRRKETEERAHRRRKIRRRAEAQDEAGVGSGRLKKKSQERSKRTFGREKKWRQEEKNEIGAGHHLSAEELPGEGVERVHLGLAVQTGHLLLEKHLDVGLGQFLQITIAGRLSLIGRKGEERTKGSRRGDNRLYSLNLKPGGTTRGLEGGPRVHATQSFGAACSCA